MGPDGQIIFSRSMFLLAWAGLAVATPAMAAPVAATVPPPGRALLLIPLTLTKVQDLHFGTIVPSTTTAGFVSINAVTGVRTGSAGLTLMPTDVGQRGQFAGAGTPGRQVIMALTPPTDLTNIVAIACGQDNFLVQRPDGTITAWGAGQYEWALFPNYGQSFPPTGLKRVISLVGARRRGMALYAVAPKPFSLSNSGYTQNGGFSIFFGGEADQSYQLQLSDNLVDWLNVLEVNSETGFFWINDSDAVNYPATYYRGMAQDYPTVP